MRYVTALILLFSIQPAFGQTPELTIQLGHSKLIYDVAYSPDGKYAASASADRTVKIWELDEGREVLTIYIDEGYATSVQFSQDSRELLVGGGSYDIGELKIYDLETANVVNEFIGHEEYAWNAEFTPDGSRVVSTSFDQTVKIWDRSTGKELYTTEVLPSLMRQLSVDPMGEYIATTCDDDSVGATLWSAEDLAFERQLFVDDMFEARTIKFSGDGQYIIVGNWDQRVAVFKRDKAEPEYIVNAHVDFTDDLIRSLSADKAGKYFFTGSSDRLIHQFELASGKKVGTFSGHADEVYALDVHPNEELLLSGGSFDKSLKEWSITRHTMERNFGGFVYPVRELAISDDGNRLYINSSDRMGGDVYSWRLDRMNSMTNLGKTDQHYQFMDIHNDRILISGNSGDIELFDANTNSSLSEHFIWKSINDALLHPSGESVLLSLKDSADNVWSYGSYREFYFDDESVQPFTSNRNREPGEQELHFNASRSAYFVMETNWDRRNRITKYDAITDSVIYSHLDTAMFYPSFEVCPDDRYILIIYSGDVILYDMEKGDAVWEEDSVIIGDVQHISFIDENRAIITGGGWSSGFVAVFDINERKVLNYRADFNSGQGAAVYDSKRDLIISGGGDARITLMDANSLETKLTLFAFADSRGEWAAVHPSGLFDGSKEAIERYLYFTYKLEPIKLFQLKERYYEPGLIQKVLGYNAEPLRDVSRFNDVTLYPKANLKVEGNELLIGLTRRSGGIGRISFLINGKEQLEDISSRFQVKYDIDAKDKIIKIDLDKYSRFLTPGENSRLEIITSNLEGTITSPVYHVNYTPALPSGFGTVTVRPTLHALVVGTSDYRGESLDLNFASKDAEDMAKALESGGHDLYGTENVNIHLLNSDQQDASLLPTKENINEKMLQIAKDSRPEDVFLLYLSGHGVTYGDQNAQFHYLTKDVESGDISDAGIRENYTVSTNDMTNWINAIPAQKQIMILDACSSGQAVDDLLSLSKNVSSSQIKALDKMKDRTGLFIVAGSAANKVSFEASQFGQSLLTYSLLSGMNIISSKSEDRMVDLVDWLNYSKEQVPELAGTIGGIQEPIVALPRNLNSFDIARIDEDKMIEVAEVKPVFVRTTLMDMNEMDDVLSLSDKLDDYFQSYAVKGRNSEVIFIDVKRFPSAYSIKGLYESIDGKTSVNATLRKGSDMVGAINVEGSADNADAIIEQILDEVDLLMR